MNKKRIFTFWEPKENVPGYIALCMRTWSRHLPDYEVVVLDWKNLSLYLTPQEMAAVVCKDMTLAMQSDCLRCLLLLKYGGIWMDADTILTRRIDDLLHGDGCLFIGRCDAGRVVNYGAFIAVEAPGSPFLLSWYSALLPRICMARQHYHNPVRRLLQRDRWRDIRRWDYCINAIIDPLCNQEGQSLDYRFVDQDAIGALPELDLQKHPQGVGLTAKELYLRYWFESAEVASEENCRGGIVLLHNSWTPQRFREMSEREFLSCDIRIATVLRRILGDAEDIA